MKRMVGLAAATVVLVGCAPARPPPTADVPPASVQGPAVTRGYRDGIVPTERIGGPPSMPWPKVQVGLAARANEAELAIILRGHELHERHPAATPGELAEILARDDVWKQHAKFVQSGRRALVAQEALRLW